MEYKATVDWSSLLGFGDVADIDLAASALLETEVFTSSVEFDALNRPINSILPDATELQPTFNKANFLESLTANVRGAASTTTFVNNIDYDEKGQRTRIQYGNGTSTAYTYNPETFRLDRLLTTRLSDSAKLQDLNYTFDAVGNITELTDDAQQTVFFANTVVSPNSKYEYDPLYRLLKATGREHATIDQHNHSGLPINIPVPHVNDATAVRKYTQQFEYDVLGNMLKMIHSAAGGSWTREYEYATTHNRLVRTSYAGGWVNYGHDAHGNMTSMPHLTNMSWDFTDQLKEVDLGGGGTAYYVYSGGERVRKVIETAGATVKDRLYLGGVEIYRERVAGTLDLERETLHISDDTGRICVVETLSVDAGSVVSSPVSLLRYQYSNHLGSAALEVDDSGSLISYEEYHPFGTSAYRSGRNVAEVSLKRYRYVGKERDEESGLYYYGARYYAGWLCRFVSVDPLKDKLPFYTPYQYAGNKPVIGIDLDGLEPANKVEPGGNDNGLQGGGGKVLGDDGNYYPSGENNTVTITDVAPNKDSGSGDVSGALGVGVVVVSSVAEFAKDEAMMAKTLQNARIILQAAEAGEIARKGWSTLMTIGTTAGLTVLLVVLPNTADPHDTYYEPIEDPF